ncbi:hypothetical protein PENSOL_c137G01906 [Penicillium solitum]|uniref:Uncharacterized protein n=1 Tax=Penicillium solitum TaxID=60172 RepID=A0A1V6Q3R9_9EURO|nr:uncharacterized protein PENSOL_c137G01906 [Penicillium solitum]OQD83910.1 hypothetical protein PENSOL_c137G01906 [Penicillium solitum]
MSLVHQLWLSQTSTFLQPGQSSTLVHVSSFQATITNPSSTILIEDDELRPSWRSANSQVQRTSPRTSPEILIEPNDATSDDGEDTDKVDKVDTDAFDTEEVDVSAEDISPTDIPVEDISAEDVSAEDVSAKDVPAEEVGNENGMLEAVYELPTFNPLYNLHPA